MNKELCLIKCIVYTVKSDTVFSLKAYLKFQVLIRPELFSSSTMNCIKVHRLYFSFDFNQASTQLICMTDYEI